MADLDVACAPERGAMISVIDDVKGSSIEDLERLKAVADIPPAATPPTELRFASTARTPSDAVGLPEYLNGLRDGVERAVSGRGDAELARFLLPLLNANLLERLEAATLENRQARQNLQRTIELSDPARAEQLAATRDRVEAVVETWRVQLEQSVDVLRSSIAHAFSQTAAIDGSSTRVRRELVEEANKLRRLASDLDMGALRKVWEEKLRLIVDEELETMLHRIDAQERSKKDRVASTLRDAFRVVEIDGSGFGEPLVERCRACACKQIVLKVLNDIRDTFTTNAAHIAVNTSSPTQ